MNNLVAKHASLLRKILITPTWEHCFIRSFFYYPAPFIKDSLSLLSHKGRPIKPMKLWKKGTLIHDYPGLNNVFVTPKLNFNCGLFSQAVHCSLKGFKSLCLNVAKLTWQPRDYCFFRWGGLGYVRVVCSFLSWILRRNYDTFRALDHWDLV